MAPCVVSLPPVLFQQFVPGVAVWGETNFFESASTFPNILLLAFCLRDVIHVIQASESWDGRPRNNIIRYNTISDPAEGQGVAVTGSDNNEILDNTFAGIDRLRFVDAQNNLLQGNDLPNGVAITLEDATLAEGSQSGTD